MVHILVFPFVDGFTTSRKVVYALCIARTFLTWFGIDCTEGGCDGFCDALYATVCEACIRGKSAVKNLHAIQLLVVDSE